MSSPSNGQWLYTELLHGNERYFGSDVFNNLTMDTAGDLYGTASGHNGCIDQNNHGYIFELARTGNGWQYVSLISWDDYTTFDSSGALALDAHGDLYGTTSDCGRHNQGTVWQFNTQ